MMIYENIAEFVVLLAALVIGRTYVNLTAFALISTYLLWGLILTKGIGLQPAEWSGDFTWYWAGMFWFYVAFSFAFCIQRTRISMAMGGLMILQCLVSLMLVVNGGSFESETYGTIDFSYEDYIYFISKQLNDIIWLVECVLAWIAAYIARDSK